MVLCTAKIVLWDEFSNRLRQYDNSISEIDINYAIYGNKMTKWQENTNGTRVDYRRYVTTVSQLTPGKRSRINKFTPMAKTYKIFISHSWDHVDDLMRLRNLLIQRGYFNVEFEEVPPHDPIDSYNSSYVKSRVSQRISESDVVIGLAGMYASYSDWMAWELDRAIALGKPVLGVIPWGAERVSNTVSSRADKIVGWNTESIVDAIRTLA